MSSQVRAAAPPARDLGQLLLDAKLSPPELRPGSVSRARLIEAARSRGCRVVGVTAPAGYGKSTLLAEWAGMEDRRVAWVSLDRFDDDPATFLAVLAAAYARVDPSRPGLVEEVGGLGMSVLGRAAPRLAAAFGACPAPFVLMLDDFHELALPACHDVLGLVVARLPPGSQLVTASRSEQPHLARLRAAGDAMELVATDLALDAAGARQIFSAEQVGLSPEQAAAVAERTEGWPVGLYLAAMVAREGHGLAGAVSGDDRYVADYLYHESLARLPEEVQQFLRRTAVLDQLSGPLCDAVLESSGSADQLRRLEASSLFVVALDRRREWYRYHALFREFLMGELRRAQSADIEELHLRAADWYESNGSAPLALEHLLRTAERDRTVRLLAKITVSMYQKGQLSTLLRWHSTVSEEGIKSFPPLAVQAAFGAIWAGDTKGAERWAAFVDATSFDGEPLSGTASFDSGRARLRATMCAGGPEAMLADAAFAASQERPGSLARNAALVVLGEAHLVAGNGGDARAVFAEVSRLSSADALIRAEAELALLAMDEGCWEEAAASVGRALTTIDEKRMQDYVLSALAHVGAARLYLHQGDLGQTRHWLAVAMRGRAAATYVIPWLAVALRLQLAKVYLTLTDTTTAHHLLREIDDILARRPRLGALTDQVKELRRVLATRPVGATGAPPLTTAELRLLPYLQTHLTLGAIAGRLFVSRSTINSEVVSIYRKLGVSSRGDAVDRAMALGMLGG